MATIQRPSAQMDVRARGDSDCGDVRVVEGYKVILLGIFAAVGWIGYFVMLMRFKQAIAGWEETIRNFRDYVTAIKEIRESEIPPTPSNRAR